MTPEEDWIEEPADPDLRLREVGPGLSVSLLCGALRRGRFLADQVTSNHPKVTAGSRMWEEVNCACRDELQPYGWTREGEDGRVEGDGLPKTFYHPNGVALYATSGTEGTGLAHCIPTTKNPRGPLASQDVVDNRQLDIPGEGFGRIRILDERTRTWILLYHYYVMKDAAGLVLREGVRAEFSFPIVVSKSGRIAGWSKRIFLPEIDLLENTTKWRPSDDEPDLEVPIERRGA